MGNHRALIWTIRCAGALVALYCGLAALFGLVGALVSLYMALKHGWLISLVLLGSTAFFVGVAFAIGYAGYRMAFHFDRTALENFAFLFAALTATGVYRLLVHGLKLGTDFYLPGIASMPMSFGWGHNHFDAGLVWDEGTVAFLAFGLFFLLYWLTKTYLLHIFGYGKREKLQ